jgi:membrane-bound lytic murein transglycosylase D
LGLQVSETLDERRDFYKSTQAAAKFTKRLHNMFHDWLLVVAAYNCGPSPVLRHLSKTGGKSFWDIKQYLPKETQNHVMAFIAASVYYDKNSKVLDLGFLPKETKNITKKDMGTAVAKNKKTSKEVAPTPAPADDEDDLAIDVEEAGTPGLQILPEEAAQVITLKIKGPYNLESIAEILDCDLNKLRRWNPKFNEQTAVAGSLVKLSIPSNKLDVFLIQKEKILSACIKNPIKVSGNTVFIPQKGAAKPIETPNAKNIPAASIKPNAVINNAPTTKPILAKTQIAPIAKPALEAKQIDKKIEPTIASTPKAIEPKISKQKKSYIVKKGDNLNSIAEEFGLSVAKLMELNKLKKGAIQPGQSIIVE